MRLLPERHDHGGGGVAPGQTETDRRRHRRGDHQHLSLRDLPAGTRRDPRHSQRVTREVAMTMMPNIDRRSFLSRSAAMAGSAGLALGFYVPFAGEASAAEAAPEVNAWVVIKP